MQQHSTKLSALRPSSPSLVPQWWWWLIPSLIPHQPSRRLSPHTLCTHAEKEHGQSCSIFSSSSSSLHCMLHLSLTSHSCRRRDNFRALCRGPGLGRGTDDREGQEADHGRYKTGYTITSFWHDFTRVYFSARRKAAEGKRRIKTEEEELAGNYGHPLFFQLARF